METLHPETQRFEHACSFAYSLLTTYLVTCPQHVSPIRDMIDTTHPIPNGHQNPDGYPILGRLYQTRSLWPIPDPRQRLQQPSACGNLSTLSK